MQFQVLLFRDVQFTIQDIAHNRQLCTVTNKPRFSETSIPRNFWSEFDNHKKFIEWASKQLNIKETSDWYNVSLQDFKDIGGFGLLHKYKGSPSLLLSTVFPDYDWLPWKFSAVPHNFWNDEKNQRKFMDWAAKQLNIKEIQDWYKLNQKVFFKLKFQVENKGFDLNWRSFFA
jgi:hypothetical protein